MANRVLKFYIREVNKYSKELLDEKQHQFDKEKASHSATQVALFESEEDAKYQTKLRDEQIDN